VADVLRQSPGGDTFLFRGNAEGKWMADLPSIALAGLAAAGVPGESLDATGPCTVCSRSFHSWRREKSLTGRQLSFIYITGAFPR
jgi:copper oxidase (laccase) domain-containing protein